MPIRILAAALLSAALMFFWGFVYWSLLGAGARVNDPVPADNELDLLAVMRNAGMETGMYVYPFPCKLGDEAGQTEMERKMAEGPCFQLAFIKGAGPAMGPMMGQGYAHMALVALLVAGLTALAGAGLPTFGRRFAFVLLAGLVTAVWANGSDAIWWMHPWSYALGNFLYYAVAAALMALPIAALVKPRLADL